MPISPTIPGNFSLPLFVNCIERMRLSFDCAMETC